MIDFLQLGHKYYFVYGETNSNGSTTLSILHEEITGVIVEKSKIFSDKNIVYLRTPRLVLSCPDILGKTPEEAVKKYKHHLDSFILPTAEEMLAECQDDNDA